MKKKMIVGVTKEVYTRCRENPVLVVDKGIVFGLNAMLDAHQRVTLEHEGVVVAEFAGDATVRSGGVGKYIQSLADNLKKNVLLLDGDARGLEPSVSGESLMSYLRDTDIEFTDYVLVFWKDSFNVFKVVRESWRLAPEYQTFGNGSNKWQGSNFGLRGFHPMSSTDNILDLHHNDEIVPQEAYQSAKTLGECFLTIREYLAQSEWMKRKLAKRKFLLSLLGWSDCCGEELTDSIALISTASKEVLSDWYAEGLREFTILALNKYPNLDTRQLENEYALVFSGQETNWPKTICADAVESISNYLLDYVREEPEKLIDLEAARFLYSVCPIMSDNNLFPHAGDKAYNYNAKALSESQIPVFFY